VRPPGVGIGVGRAGADPGQRDLLEQVREVELLAKAPEQVLVLGSRDGMSRNTSETEDRTVYRVVVKRAPGVQRLELLLPGHSLPHQQGAPGNHRVLRRDHLDRRATGPATIWGSWSEVAK
jgi:hypothetical protein